MHGSYVPDPEIAWSLVDGNKDHHQVWLRRRPRGHAARTRVLLGEVRRYRLTGRDTRKWRAFPEGAAAEYPTVHKNHYEAMAYLLARWEEVHSVRVEPDYAPLRAAAPPADGWERFAGEDPWAAAE